ncbi:MAG: phasin family protein [Alphaproteobacteria bacterium]
MTKTSNQFDTFFKETSDFGANYSEACTKSGTILMKGMEDIVTTMVSLAQKSAEKQSKFMKDAMSCKTINEFAEAQNKIAQTGFDDFMSGATKISEISVKALTDGVEPVSAQVTKVMEKATKSMAA